MKKHFTSALSAFFFIASLWGCSSAIKNKNNGEQVQSLYRAGIQKLDRNARGADADFQAALSLNRRSPYGYTGLALFELNRGNLGEALEYADRAIKFGSDFADAYVAKGRILTQRERRNWYRQASACFEKAIELQPEDQKAYFYYAECHLKARNYEEALNKYAEAAKLSGNLAQQARRQSQLFKEVVAINPLSQQGWNIALQERLDRAAAATLITNELKIKELMADYNPEVFSDLYSRSRRGRTTQNFPVDVDSRSLRQEIADIALLGLDQLEIMPDGRFYPDRPLTRAQFAMIMMGLMDAVMPDSELLQISTYYHPDFLDVREDFYAYKAIRFCVDNNIMDANNSTREFRPDGNITGVEAVRMLRELKKLINS